MRQPRRILAGVAVRVPFRDWEEECVSNRHSLWKAGLESENKAEYVGDEGDNYRVMHVREVPFAHDVSWRESQSGPSFLF